MNGLDAPGTEYRPGFSTIGMPPVEAALSLANWLDCSVAAAGSLLMRGDAGPAIEARQRQRREVEQRAAGYIACPACSGAVRPGSCCGCGEVAPGSTLDGIDASRIMRRRYVVPS